MELRLVDIEIIKILEHSVLIKVHEPRDTYPKISEAGEGDHFTISIDVYGKIFERQEEE